MPRPSVLVHIVVSETQSRNASCYDDNTKGGNLAQASRSQSLCALHEPPRVDMQPQNDASPYSFMSDGSWSDAPSCCDGVSVCMNVTRQQQVQGQ